ncbi:hypothetical protein ABB37_07787 [Leptomonas pyrrhocoris]|uniref:Uncharacterized protein n=1 Tax=Leptomonas pyrrhocoris TaxID=157538 RepID=A0A0M9FV26_LEPPY|nr:hypothetical protein ABB37_07787 [Leptomonas pyrrhocoris]KPA76476.1 hypothetical protein ABB37_07787 [Leptomonas pyrrhocoris]|eukprot:XP_015654915.1 hypothetical protein ABB37_07787 [Leptomonas pyrrhocoris]
MLRRVAPRLMIFTTGGGTALRAEARPTTATPQPAADTEKSVGVYLPWTARPWEVTHCVHHSQWKFLDTVFSHLAALTPAELSERAREQGAGDVLCDLEEPASALRRQRARQARQRRRQEKAAPDTPTAAAGAYSGRADAVASLLPASLASAVASSVPHSTSWKKQSNPLAFSPGEAKGAPSLPPPPAAGLHISPAGDAPAPPAAEVRTASAPQDVAAVTTDGDGDAARNDRLDSTSTSRKKKSKRQKRSKRSVDVIHYV